MTVKRCSEAAILVSFVVLFFCGCAPETDVVLKPDPGQAYTYKVVDVFRKEYLFDQPSSEKITEKITEATVETTFEQLIKDVDAEGNTTAEINIKAVKYYSTSANTVQVDFDSSRGTDSKSALAKLIGKTYTIKLSPLGKVLEISDVEPSREAVKTGTDAPSAGRFLSENAIQRRHEILAMPDQDKKTLKVGDSWSQVVASPQGVLIPKNYEKVYTVKKITDGRLALIEMSATPTSKRLESQTGDESAMDMFRNFFDSEDNFTGRLLIDTETGKVYEYSVNFRNRYTAAEFPKEDPKPDQPDVLNLAFTETHSVELVEW